MADKGNKSPQASSVENRYPNDYTSEIEDSRGLFEYLFLDLPMGLNRFGIYRAYLRFLTASNVVLSQSLPYLTGNATTGTLFNNWSYGALAKYDHRDF